MKKSDAQDHIKL